jgi:uncharacterized DUF497 family protein
MRLFVWDRKKARQNPVRHRGVTFHLAMAAFYDPRHICDLRNRYGEQQWTVTGIVEGVFITCACEFLEPSRLRFVDSIEADEYIRIITAWPSERREADHYAEENRLWQ